MRYHNTLSATFISRPNRFIANCAIDGKTVACHVKNTGRCQELLVPGAQVILQKSGNQSRKTLYDLIAVYKGTRLINIDSQAPNKVFAEFLQTERLFTDIALIKPEFTYGNSRFDFYINAGNREILVEVKGVTLEESDVVLFPDAPTQRGLKHLQELLLARKNGYEAYVVFIIQMSGVNYFSPNIRTHQAFGAALQAAETQGVKILALDCLVTENSIKAKDYVKVVLDPRAGNLPSLSPASGNIGSP